MLNLSIPWWEFVVRALVVFGFLLFALRVLGKKQIGQLAPFDLVLLLILSNAVQNSMNAGDNSLLGGLISAATLLLLDYFFGWVTFKNKRASKLIEGRPEVLIHDGKIFEKTLIKERINHNTLEEALRKEGVFSIQDVHYAILENSGAISVIRKKDKTT
ncbi:DUF421 domain-containing protein [Bdellovibrio svalbardensis]|uniref:DUF421 domain-containing protein n=1 Tax=Bdellovibrio svalbardensis TaxID=2972972 RepID=A0ABT6DLL2_9BACT|nr:YetF domain-containing protein [Bdellovibrio svalbardensis]MDG0816799.1 DUF421 domain-containing protein [Bdellovibrio svalbardensis]